MLAMLSERVRTREQFYNQYGGQLQARLIQDVGQALEGYRTMHAEPQRLDLEVAEALATVPRHKFISEYSFSKTYRNTILGLEEEESLNGATASEPALVAFMTQLVMPDGDIRNATALDVGSGSGYQTAILSAVGFSHVTGIEIKPHLAERSREILKDTPGVQIITGDVKQLSPRKKFDAIVVAAQATNLDDVANLCRNLKIGGKMVIPVSVAALISSMEGDHPELPKLAEEKGVIDLAFLTVFTRTGKNTFREAPQTVVKFVDLV